MAENKTLLHISDVSKSYPGVRALDGVSLEVERGEVHGLVGANGAGKSTLIKILAGAVQPDSGSLVLNGRQMLPLTPRKSKEMGIQVIHQDLNLVPLMTVAENIFLGDEIKRRLGLVKKREMRSRTEEIFQGLGVPVNPDARVIDLSVSLQQMVAVAAAILRKTELLILDETTATIAGKEVERLFERIRRLSESGIGIIFVSHHLEEILAICDRISILRDGRSIGTRNTKDTSKNDLITMMIGTAVTEQFPRREKTPGHVLLALDKVRLAGRKAEISFTVRSGEIVGLFGLVGSGRTEIARMIFCADRPAAGTISINGSPIKNGNTSKAVSRGIGLLPEDRKGQGLLLDMSVGHNITLSSIKNLSRALLIRGRRERKTVLDQIQSLSIVTPSSGQRTRALSGGN